MKKASQILLLVGMILSFVWAASYFCAGVAFVVGGAVGGTNLPKILAYFGIDLSEYGLTPEQLQAFTYAFMFTMGGFFILWSGFAIANGVIAYLGRQKQNKTFYIMNIIFGVLSGVEVNGVGGVFGLFTLPKREEIAE